MALHVTSLFLKDDNLSNLWRLDVLGILDPAENKDQIELQKETMQYFERNLKKDCDGRYEVALPWISNHAILPTNRRLAERRLTITKRKLKSLERAEDYETVFDDWLTQGIIEEVTKEEEANCLTHYLPHRPVIKESSATTKIRPVFDASSHEKGFPSLNDCLTKGPNLIEILPAIVNRFRKFHVGVTSDIEKAFLQIRIRAEDRDFLRFLWKNDEDTEKTYRHCRVVFGVTSSPFLLSATLNHHLKEAPEPFLKTTRILLESFFVDNCVTSLNEIEKLSEFVNEAQLLMSSALFNLRDWKSNIPLDLKDRSRPVEEETVPVLGLNWNPKDDSLFLKVEANPGGFEIISKRLVLSLTNRIFDPIGFSSPVTLMAKLIIQEIWNLKLTWDKEVPEHISEKFLRWLAQLPTLAAIRIPRWLSIEPDISNASLHVFCDSSKHAYAACVFVRTETNFGIKVQLIQSKSRVAPLRNITIPRLELMACCIGARLADSIIKDMHLNDIRRYYWSDSTTVLCWIRRDVQWGTFVMNRVQEIRTLTNIKDWYHVPGKENPADLPSRGCSAEQLLNLRWWEGPTWLLRPECEWPQIETLPDEETINCEKRKTVLTSYTSCAVISDWYSRRFSSFEMNIKVLAWIYRFVNKARKRNSNSSDSLSLDEIQQAEISLIKLIQNEVFKGVTDKNLRSLRPVLDSQGVFRVKTQIFFRKDTETFNSPIILPTDHPLVHSLIRSKHNEFCHAGISILMAVLREKFWIIKSRKAIRKVIQQCGQCKRINAKRAEVTAAPLPEDRVNDANVFKIVGVDLAGPLYLKEHGKAWIVLYTCAVYRAVHLELITSLSTDAFVLSFRRFIARRGLPSTVYSDNGTNFVGTNSALSDIDWDKVNSEAILKRIRWKFNPPSAPWWGGWWERMIRMMKDILRRVLGRASLTYEELMTVLCDCEQILNSRPLTYISEEVEDLAPLTPAMFLQEIRSSNVSDLDLVDFQKLSKRAKYRHKVREQLRERFRSEYLGQLRQRCACKNKTWTPSVGDVILLEGNKSRIYWSLAKILELIPGKDGVVRLVRVKTSKGELLRPLQRLYPLEVDDSSSSTPVEPLTKCLNPKVSGRTRFGRTVKPPERLNL